MIVNGSIHRNMSVRPYFIMPECITTFRKDTVGGPHRVTLTTIYAANMIAIIIFNTLLIIGICKTRKKNKFTSSNKLFLLLCSSDLLAGVVLMPLQIYFVNLVPNMTCMHTAVRAFWNAFPVVLSGTNILVLTLDRYLMMVKNELYHRWFSKTRLLGLIVAIEILISFGWAFWYVFTTQSLDPHDAAVFFIGLSSYQFLILASVVILNVKMVRHVKLSRKGTTLSGHHRAEDILSRTISMVSFALIICYIPGTIATGTAGFYSLYSRDRESLNRITTTLIYCFLPTQINSSVNAIIYLSKNTRIQSFYRNVCCACFGKGNAHHSSAEGLDTNDSLASHRGMLKHSTKRDGQKKKHYHTYVMAQQSLASSNISLDHNNHHHGNGVDLENKTIINNKVEQTTHEL